MIHVIDLTAQQGRLRSEIEGGITRVRSHGQYTLGAEVAELAEKLAAHTGAAHYITVANGTHALQLAFMAMVVGPRDEVISPGFSYIAPAEAAVLPGAEVVYLDIAPDTNNLSRALLDAAITPRPGPSPRYRSTASRLSLTQSTRLPPNTKSP